MPFFRPASLPTPADHRTLILYSGQNRMLPPVHSEDILLRIHCHLPPAGKAASRSFLIPYDHGIIRICGPTFEQTQPPFLLNPSFLLYTIPVRGLLAWVQCADRVL